MTINGSALRTGMFWVAVMLLTACAKTGGIALTTTGSGSDYLIQSDQTSLYGDTINSIPEIQERAVYLYDGNGREVSAIATGAITENGTTTAVNDTTLTSYSTSTDTIYRITHGASGIGGLESINYFNAAGTEVDSSLDIFYYQNAISEENVTTYTYDGMGNCTGTTYGNRTNGSFTLQESQFFTYANGNMVEITDILNGRNVTYVTSLSYGSVTGNIDYLLTSLPVPATPVIQHPTFDLLTILIQSDNGAPGTSIYFTYTFDSQHRVTSYTGGTFTGKPLVQLYNISYLHP